MEPSDTSAAFEAIVRAERQRARREQPRSQPVEPPVLRHVPARQTFQTYISGALLGAMAGLGAGALLGATWSARVLPAAPGALFGVAAGHRYMRWPKAQGLTNSCGRPRS